MIDLGKDIKRFQDESDMARSALVYEKAKSKNLATNLNREMEWC